jgi:hypothetical protein
MDMSDEDELRIFRKMLDRNHWPIRLDKNYVIVNGEIYCFRTDHPLEECVYKPLFR